MEKRFKVNMVGKIYVVFFIINFIFTFVVIFDFLCQKELGNKINVMDFIIVLIVTIMMSLFAVVFTIFTFCSSYELNDKSLIMKIFNYKLKEARYDRIFRCHDMFFVFIWIWFIDEKNKVRTITSLRLKNEKLFFKILRDRCPFDCDFSTDIEYIVYKYEKELEQSK